MWDSCLWQRIVVFLAVFVNSASACTYLTATNNSFGVITLSYNESHEDECWIIDAGLDCIVHAFANKTMVFERRCNDKLVLRCNDENGPTIDTFYSSGDTDDVYSSREKMYVRFTRESPCTGNDFIIYYEALISDSHSASCRHHSNPPDEDKSSLAMISFPIVYVICLICWFLGAFCKLNNCCGKKDVTSDVRYIISNKQNDNNASVPVSQPPAIGNC